MMTVTLSADVEARVANEASRRGIGPQALAMALIEQGLPPMSARPDDGTATLALLDRWRREDESNETSDPVELARRERDQAEFLRAVDRHADEKRETD